MDKQNNEDTDTQSQKRKLSFSDLDPFSAPPKRRNKDNSEWIRLFKNKETRLSMKLDRDPLISQITRSLCSLSRCTEYDDLEKIITAAIRNVHRYALEVRDMYYNEDQIILRNGKFGPEICDLMKKLYSCRPFGGYCSLSKNGRPWYRWRYTCNACTRCPWCYSRLLVKIINKVNDAFSQNLSETPYELWRTRVYVDTPMCHETTPDAVHRAKMNVVHSLQHNSKKKGWYGLYRIFCFFKYPYAMMDIDVLDYSQKLNIADLPLFSVNTKNIKWKSITQLDKNNLIKELSKHWCFPRVAVRSGDHTPYFLGSTYRTSIFHTTGI